jgi:hypothetical protein
MNFWLEILIGIVFSFFLYFVFRAMILFFAERELDSSEKAIRKHDAIEVFADSESLEYYVRLALVAAEGKTEVIAYVKKDSAVKADMLDTVTKLKKNHRNLSYRLI